MLENEKERTDTYGETPGGYGRSAFGYGGERPADAPTDEPKEQKAEQTPAETSYTDQVSAPDMPAAAPSAPADEPPAYTPPATDRPTVEPAAAPSAPRTEESADDKTADDPSAGPRYVYDGVSWQRRAEPDGRPSGEPSYGRPTYGTPVQPVYAAPRRDVIGGTALAAGILAILSSALGYPGIVFGLFAILLALLAKKVLAGATMSGVAMGGVVCGAIGLALGLFFLLIIVFAEKSGMLSDEFWREYMQELETTGAFLRSLFF